LHVRADVKAALQKLAMKTSSCVENVLEDHVKSFRHPQVG
jgi:hypothetical protein